MCETKRAFKHAFLVFDVANSSHLRLRITVCCNVSPVAISGRLRVDQRSSKIILKGLMSRCPFLQPRRKTPKTHRFWFAQLVGSSGSSQGFRESTSQTDVG